ncbi:MAG: hypothetical protein FWE86_03825, partial [Oscillospiraceae bacterium]|nr:hypothetical protein [Oscillospiraceae bacterium]
MQRANLASNIYRPLSNWQAYVMVAMSALLGFTLSYGSLSGSWLAAQLLCDALAFGSIFLMIYTFRKGGYSDIT